MGRVCNPLLPFCAFVHFINCKLAEHKRTKDQRTEGHTYERGYRGCTTNNAEHCGQSRVVAGVESTAYAGVCSRPAILVTFKAGLGKDDRSKGLLR